MSWGCQGHRLVLCLHVTLWLPSLLIPASKQLFWRHQNFAAVGKSMANVSTVTTAAGEGLWSVCGRTDKSLVLNLKHYWKAQYTIPTPSLRDNYRWLCLYSCGCSPGMNMLKFLLLLSALRWNRVLLFLWLRDLYSSWWHFLRFPTDAFKVSSRAFWPLQAVLLWSTLNYLGCTGLGIPRTVRTGGHGVWAGQPQCSHPLQLLGSFGCGTYSFVRCFRTWRIQVQSLLPGALASK